jgi:hypothetical protein
VYVVERATVRTTIMRVTLAEAEMELATVKMRAAAFRAGALPSEYRDVLVTMGLAGE